MICIHQSKRTHVEKVKKQAEFYNMLRRAYGLIVEYASNVLSLKIVFEWNGVEYDMKNLHSLFILFLCRDFTTLQNNRTDLTVS